MSGSRRYQRGAFDPRQEMLLPQRVADFVDQDNPVRAIAAYVDSCQFGIGGVTSAWLPSSVW